MSELYDLAIAATSSSSDVDRAILAIDNLAFTRILHRVRTARALIFSTMLKVEDALAANASRIGANQLIPVDEFDKASSDYLGYVLEYGQHVEELERLCDYLDYDYPDKYARVLETLKSCVQARTN